MTVVLTTRDELVDTLHLAAELEHNLMCQYLFAAYSMKRSTAEGLDEVQAEATRAWEACITLVARQEMEHLGLVLNLLAAIGGPPTLRRPNFPQDVAHYGALGIRSVLTRFGRDTIARFQEFEAPHDPGPTPDYCHPASRLRGAPGEREARVRDELLRERDEEQRPLTAIAPGEIPFTSVEDLYVSLAQGFVRVAATIGEEELFNGPFDSEIWGGPGSPYGEGSMDDLNQYGLDIIQVTDLRTAIDAIVEIVKQGEGVLAPPDYMEHVHYCLFTEILDAIGGFDAARPVVDNPLVSMHPDISAPDEVNLITDPATREVAEVFNGSYELMLLLMLYLYGDVTKSQDQSVALMNAIFFPLMTMFVRPLSEILTTLPAFDDGRAGNAGPGFELSEDLLSLPARELIWEDFQVRFDALTARLAGLSIYGLRPPDDPVVVRLRYLADNMRRLAEDWRSDWQDVGRTS
jgi:hypothetical protein